MSCAAFPTKRRFETEALAKEAAEAQRILQSYDRIEMRSYCCRTCQGWHLSSRGPNEKKQRAASYMPGAKAR